MPYTFECPLRWADMDLLGHVNNVTYLAYVAEAREALLAGREVGRARVARHQVEFVKPLVFHRAPVLVDSWFTDIGRDQVTLAHEVYDPAQDGTERTTYLRATTVLDHSLDEAERDFAELHRGPAHTWRPVTVEAGADRGAMPLVVRRSDLGEDGLARPGVFFEFVQEARIRYLMDLHTRGERWSQHVVARTDIDYFGSVRHRPEPYDVYSRVAHVGTRSFTISSEVRDRDRVVASAAVVMVVFDLETQATAEMTEHQRARLERELAQPPSRRPRGC